jgi:hypothetical protein
MVVVEGGTPSLPDDAIRPRPDNFFCPLSPVPCPLDP